MLPIELQCASIRIHHVDGALQIYDPRRKISSGEFKTQKRIEISQFLLAWKKCYVLRKCKEYRDQEFGEFGQ